MYCTLCLNEYLDSLDSAKILDELETDLAE